MESHLTHTCGIKIVSLIFFSIRRPEPKTQEDKNISPLFLVPNNNFPPNHPGNYKYTRTMWNVTML